MRDTPNRGIRSLRLLVPAALIAALVAPAGATQAASAAKAPDKLKPKITNAAAFDVSKPLRELAKTAKPSKVRPDRVNFDRAGPAVGTAKQGYSRDGALQSATAARSARSASAAAGTESIGGTIANFEGMSNQDNFNVLGGRVNPPDPNGEAGPNHFVEIVNLVFAVYTKTGTKLLGPVRTGSLWSDFPITECAANGGDPVVLYDQVADRWIITQLTTRGINFPDEPLNLFYNCFAISTTGDPTGSYFRYAFTTGFNFPDYPKIGIWKDSYIITTREFGILDPSIYGIGVYGLERNKLIEGEPGARAVGFLATDTAVPLNLIGDGLLPPDVDGKTKPKADAPAPIVGTQDDTAPYGATSDALNIWEFDVKWRSTPVASLVFKAQLPVAPFDSVFPCVGGFGSRDCLPQPGITNPAQFLDILSYRQRPTFRLAYRNLGTTESMVTNQSVEAMPGVAGVRWYEIRRTNGEYSVHQQGTYAPGDGVHRWMGSIAADKNGNMALGYSVVNGTDVFPGIRYTGRLAGDPLGQMTLGEGTAINGTAAQTHVNSRWGDYTDLTVDPVDDCTFWYVNEYYTVEGAATAPLGNGWQTRIASFKLPGC